MRELETLATVRAARGAARASASARETAAAIFRARREIAAARRPSLPKGCGGRAVDLETGRVLAAGLLAGPIPTHTGVGGGRRKVEPA